MKAGGSEARDAAHCCGHPPKKPVRSTAASAEKEGLPAKVGTGNHSDRKRRMLGKVKQKKIIKTGGRRGAGVLNHSMVTDGEKRDGCYPGTERKKVSFQDANRSSVLLMVITVDR